MPLPYCNPNCRTPRHWKFTQHHRTTRPTLSGRRSIYTEILSQRAVKPKSINQPTLMADLRLDPFQYHTVSSFAWDSAVKYSSVFLELITYLELHLCVETVIRGERAVLGTPRYARVNNQDLPEGLYDPQKETSTIYFFDFIGLYCHCMCLSLPLYGFRWLSDWELKKFDVISIPANALLHYRLRPYLPRRIA